jgi:acid phosphatase
VKSILAVLALALVAAATPADGASSTRTRRADVGVPRFSHIVVVVEENRSFGQIIGNSTAPYINHLARSGTLLTRAYGVEYGSQSDYLALFSGSTQGVHNASCPHRFDSRNLGSQLREHGMRFTGFAESLPWSGYLGCQSGRYVRRHAPWTNFTNLPRRVGKPMTRFPHDYRNLPRVSFVIPNLLNDMHDGSVARADDWLHDRLSGYATWARTHNSLLIVTWDEDDHDSRNHIPGILYGAHVRDMRYRHRVDHYRMLRTIEALCRLPALGEAAKREPLRAVWKPGRR